MKTISNNLALFQKFAILILFINLIGFTACQSKTQENKGVQQVFDKVSSHNFHPLNDENTMTFDRNLGVAGIADLKNHDWKIRLLAVRDLVRTANVKDIVTGLSHQSIDVRYICAMALGILKADQSIDKLEIVVREDKNAIVRSQAVIALGQIESKASLELLNKQLVNDPSRDVRHQCELAIDQITKQMGTTEKQLKAFLSLDESTFESVHIGNVTPNFSMDDTEDKVWEISDFQDKKWVVLIWVFADWCPVCHGEFHDLMEMQEEFEQADVQVFTIEAHDRYRGRVMVGKELDPSYWFAKESFQEAYTDQIWWPHLLDRAGAVGAMFGAQPLTFAVHAEYINRPTTVIIDPDGIVRLIYQGTYWGDRPTIKQTLKMITTENFSFKHPKRLSTEN